jgi:diacylglycerol kinase (ATP)
MLLYYNGKGCVVKDRKYLIVVNPKAGKGQTKKIVPLLERKAAKLGIVCKFMYTSGIGEGEAIARSAEAQGFTHVVGIGGDGTSHEIVNGLMGADIVFGTIPSGSGNDFPQAAGIPLEPERAVHTVLNGEVRSVDVGRLGGKYFINGLGIGLDGAVAHRFKSFRLFGGQAAYLMSSVIEALTFRGFNAELGIGEWRYSGRVLLTGASNGHSQGGFKLAPEARVDDGKLDFHIIRDMEPLSRLVKIPKVLKGHYKEIEEMDIISDQTMEITLFDQVPAHMDGQSFYLVPGTHKIEVVPGALKVMSLHNR